MGPSDNSALRVGAAAAVDFGPQFPHRYEPEEKLGQGGAGEVWAVRDRYTHQRFALKLLAADASEAEAASLVKEAVALSGLEGLGLPRVFRFGKLPHNCRLYMLRELIEGTSLDALIATCSDPLAPLSALIMVADKLTRLHRANLLHGDIKPANIIVSQDGRASLVDLGLAAPFLELGTPARGLTPKYAAPELLSGGPLTLRAEVHALGATLGDILEALTRRGLGAELGADTVRKLEEVGARARASDPQRRFPSADEFAAAVRTSTRLNSASIPPDNATLWPICGFDAIAARLLHEVLGLGPGQALHLRGPAGSGRSVLLRRLAWSLGVEGAPLVWIDDTLRGHPEAISAELSSLEEPQLATLIIDDLDRLSLSHRESIRRMQRDGARIVFTAEAGVLWSTATLDVPPLDKATACHLVRRAIPSLTPRLVDRVLSLADCRPGAVKRVVDQIATQTVASAQDIDRLLIRAADPEACEDPVEECHRLLDRGRFKDAGALFESFAEDTSLRAAVARARVSIGLGRFHEATEELRAAQQKAAQQRGSDDAKNWQLWMGRAEIGVLNPEAALPLLDELVAEPGRLGAEALTYRGLALYHSEQLDRAGEVLTAAAERAVQCGSSRVEGIALFCIGLVHRRAGRTDEAGQAYQRALAAAEVAGDASTLSGAQLNLATLLRMKGDVAGAVDQLEAAIDTGKRAGRLWIVRLALSNLACADLYLGRIQRARTSVAALREQSDQLDAAGRAQLVGLEAEILARAGEPASAIDAYQRSAAAFIEIGMREQAAEAILESVLLYPLDGTALVDEVQRQVELARVQLDGSSKHAVRYHLACAHLARLRGDEADARAELDRALTHAEAEGHREWIWRVLDVRADLFVEAGQWLMAQRDREGALLVLEETAARLPSDLREVYWNNERRQRLRAWVQERCLLPGEVPREGPPVAGTQVSPLSKTTRTPLERRLARILEINRGLLTEFDLELLTAHVIVYAAELLHAERGFVILREPDGQLSVHTSRDLRGDQVRAEFSRSIAERVMASNQPVVSLNAGRDTSMQGYASVHQLQLQAVACVPVKGREGLPIGALYLEARANPDRAFERELPTLEAFADQVGLAIQTARLVNENMERANQLADANDKLRAAQARLQEVLDQKVLKLKVARRQLRDANHMLYGHFGYQGLVGTGAAMRRVYSLIERIKDTDVPILISGESGTGKEMAARALHRGSVRAQQPFLGINCGAIPEHLLESELFGHVRGAFTGADRERKGLIREAGEGTLLLDEIGEMPMKMQASLLRVLQERKVRPVGGSSEEEIQCRLIFATHRDMRQLVDEGRFREDLYYRIVVINLELPPLREHLEDIPPLVDHFLSIFSARYKRERKTLTKEALRCLADYDWPGNVRQLEHVLLNAWVLADQPEIEDADLDLPHRPQKPPSLQAPKDVPKVEEPSSGHSFHLRDEKARMLEALNACNWNRVKAAQLLDMPRRTFYRRLKQYQLQ